MNLSAPAYRRQACLPTPVPTAGGAGRHRAGLPGNVNYDYTVGFPPRLSR